MIMIHQSKWMLEEGCDPMESPCWSRLLAGPVAPWGTHTKELCSWRAAPSGRIHEELCLMGRTYIGEVGAGLSPVGEEWSRTVSGVLSLSRKWWKKQCDELTSDALLQTSVPMRRGKLVNKWSRLCHMALSHSVVRFQIWSPKSQACATSTTLSLLCSIPSNWTRSKGQE